MANFISYTYLLNILFCQWPSSLYRTTTFWRRDRPKKEYRSQVKSKNLGAADMGIRRNLIIRPRPKTCHSQNPKNPRWIAHEYAHNKPDCDSPSYGYRLTEWCKSLRNRLINLRWGMATVKWSYWHTVLFLCLLLMLLLCPNYFTNWIIERRNFACWLQVGGTTRTPFSRIASYSRLKGDPILM